MNKTTSRHATHLLWIIIFISFPAAGQQGEEPDTLWIVPFQLSLQNALPHTPGHGVLFLPSPKYLGRLPDIPDDIEIVTTYEEIKQRAFDSPLVYLKPSEIRTGNLEVRCTWVVVLVSLNDDRTDFNHQTVTSIFSVYRHNGFEWVLEHRTMIGAPAGAYRHPPGLQ